MVPPEGFRRLAMVLGIVAGLWSGWTVFGEMYKPVHQRYWDNTYFESQRLRNPEARVVKEKDRPLLVAPDRSMIWVGGRWRERGGERVIETFKPHADVPPKFQEYVIVALQTGAGFIGGLGAAWFAVYSIAWVVAGFSVKQKNP